mgnify:CR=1 FL=1
MGTPVKLEPPDERPAPAVATSGPAFPSDEAGDGPAHDSREAEVMGPVKVEPSDDSGVAAPAEPPTAASLFTSASGSVIVRL